MSFENYKGSIELGAGLTPSGKGYPLMQTSDIQAAEDGKRLDELLAEIMTGGANLDEEISLQESLVEQIKIALMQKASAVGITSIEKTSTEGLVDTYTITFTDGSTSTFTVTNGANGKDGEQGEKGDGLEIVTTTGTGAAYKATVKGITELKAGVSFVMILHEQNTSATPSLNVNGLGAKIMCCPVSDNTVITLNVGELNAGIPFRVMYDGSFWRIESKIKIYSGDINGRVPVSKGGVPNTNAANKGKVLTTNGSGDPVWQTPTGGGVGVGVDKVKSIDNWVGGKEVDFDSNDGITWSEEFAFYDADDEVLASGGSTNRVPIVAGDNVTFTVDKENQVVKINAASGGSSAENILLNVAVSTTPSSKMSEIKDAIVAAGGDESDIAFVSLSGYIAISLLIQFRYYGGNNYLANCTNPFTGERIYSSKTENVFDITTKTIREFISEGQPTAKLPRIRFANFTHLVDEETGATTFRFTVENMGGGTLQVGDELQICCRRKYPGGKKKLRKMAYYTITEDDLNQRFLKIEVDPSDEAVQRWLFRNDREGNSTLSAMYFRFKRVTAYDGNGNECNAIFSNVEQVWKTYGTMYEDGEYILNIK